MGVFDWIAAIATVAVIVWFVYMVSRKPTERVAEDDARAFFDEHGRFPDEDPDEVAAMVERHQAQADDPAQWDSDPAAYVERDER